MPVFGKQSLNIQKDGIKVLADCYPHLDHKSSSDEHFQDRLYAPIFEYIIIIAHYCTVYSPFAIDIYPKVEAVIN